MRAPKAILMRLRSLKCNGIDESNLRQAAQWWPGLVLPQRYAVNPVRPGREQRQRQIRVPGCGWSRLPPFKIHNVGDAIPLLNNWLLTSSLVVVQV